MHLFRGLVYILPNFTKHLTRMVEALVAAFAVLPLSEDDIFRLPSAWAPYYPILACESILGSPVLSRQGMSISSLATVV